MFPTGITDEDRETFRDFIEAVRLWQERNPVREQRMTRGMTAGELTGHIRLAFPDDIAWLEDGSAERFPVSRDEILEKLAAFFEDDELPRKWRTWYDSHPRYKDYATTTRRTLLRS